MKKYFFNCREGDHLTVDRVGMYLPSLDAAHSEAVTAVHELQLAARDANEPTQDCEMQVADSSGETVLSISFEEGS